MLHARKLTNGGHQKDTRDHTDCLDDNLSLVKKYGPNDWQLPLLHFYFLLCMCERCQKASKQAKNKFYSSYPTSCASTDEVGRPKTQASNERTVR